MTSATLVVRQYEIASQLSGTLDCALIDLVKTQRQLPGYDAIDSAQLDASRRAVSAIAHAVQCALDAKSGDTLAHRESLLQLPEGLVTWLQAMHQGDAVTSHDLANVQSHLSHAGQVPPHCDDTDLLVLERLSRIMNAHTGHLFQRLNNPGSR